MNNIVKYDLSKNIGEEPLSLFDKKYQMDVTVQRVLDNGGELPGVQYDALFNHISEKKLDFINGTKKEKALAIRDLNLKSEAVKEYKAFRQDLASAYNTNALMNKWAEGDQGQAVMALLKDEARLVQKICPENMNCPDRDELGVVMPDFKAKHTAIKRIDELSQYYKDPGLTVGVKKDLDRAIKDLKKIIDTDGERWMSISNLKKLIRLKDTSTQDVIKTMGNNWLNQSAKINPMDNLVFNEQAAERQVRASVVKKSTNIQSLAYDEMIPGRTFYEDVQEKIIKTTPWKNPQDAKKVADAIINDPTHKDKLEDELVEYYTGFLKSQWTMGEKNRPRPKVQEDKKPKKGPNLDGSKNWRA